MNSSDGGYYNISWRFLTLGLGFGLTICFYRFKKCYAFLASKSEIAYDFPTIGYKIIFYESIFLDTYLELILVSGFMS